MPLPPAPIKPPPATPVYVISPSGAVTDTVRLEAATANLAAAGFKLRFDRSALKQHQRFAGRDEERAASFTRAAQQAARIVMITRGGYGITRYLDSLDFEALAGADKHWVGFSDFTAFQLAMLAKAGAVTWSGATLLESFGAPSLAEVDANTLDGFVDAMNGSLEVLGFPYRGPREVDVRGVLWGGNLTMLCSLLGTPFFPKVRKGILFIEEVNEHPYRIERSLAQLLHAGVIDAQQAVVFGYCNGYRLYENDRGYDLPAVFKWLQARTRTPILTGLPHGHIVADEKGRYTTRLTLPHGARVGLATEGRTCYLVLPHSH